MVRDYTDKVVIVTGGSRGLGLRLVEDYVKRGAHVATCARNRAGLESEISKLSFSSSQEVMCREVDVTYAEQLQRFISDVICKFGRIDVLVNNAASGRSGDLMSLSDDDWSYEFAVKFMSMVRACRSVIPMMVEQRSGAVVNVNAQFAREPHPDFFASSCVRSSCLTLTKALGRQYARQNVRINAVGVGLMDSPAWESWYDQSNGTYKDYLDRMAARYEVPAGRLASVQEVAEAVLFLTSPDASYITGVQLDVDGGLGRSI